MKKGVRLALFACLIAANVNYGMNEETSPSPALHSKAWEFMDASYDGLKGLAFFLGYCVHDIPRYMEQCCPKHDDLCNMADESSLLSPKKIISRANSAPVGAHSVAFPFLEKKNN